MLFLICFFRHFIIPISVDYQYVTNNQQDFKKKIMMTVGACIFLIAAANALPLFFGISN
jgi:UDP-N-acetyl-D-mannosaminuronic acid transferase (WecB/TagA/CpsF family)